MNAKQETLELISCIMSQFDKVFLMSLLEKNMHVSAQNFNQKVMGAPNNSLLESLTSWPKFYHTSC